MFRVLLIILGLGFSLVVPAQSPRKLLRQGDKLLHQGKVEQAIVLYQVADSLVPGNVAISLRLGAAYLESDLKHQALLYLSKAYELDPYADIDIEYLMGQAHQYSYHFTEASQHYQNFLRDNAYAEAHIKQRLQECQVGDSLIMTPQPVDITNLGPVVNSGAHDYTPVISANEEVLVFTSRRKGSTGGQLAPDQQYFEDIYVAYRTEDGDWEAARSISKNINFEFHDAATALSPDGKQLFLYKEINGGDLYISHATKQDWSRPEPLGAPINTEHWETSATITQSGSRIYFASNRPGGLGGLDLYYCDRQANGQWGPAVNLGSPVNTALDEDSPFIHPNGTILYFSSNGHRGLGQFDVFYTELGNEQWSKPANMGYPINTPENDLSFVISGDKYRAYFSSIREFGHGKADLYSATFLNHPRHTAWLEEKRRKAAERAAANATAPETAPPKEEAKPALTTLTGAVYNAQTKNPLRAHIIITNNVTSELVADVWVETTNGSFTVPLYQAGSYAVHAESQGFNFYSRNLKIGEQASTTTEFDLWLQPLSVGAKVVLANIFFDSNKASLRTESLNELRKIYDYMREAPTVSLQINGHTDDIGQAQYNKILSKHRAQAVVDYLIRQGIESRRLKAVGFGEEQPLVSNDDEFDGRAINRRTEIEILSF